MPYDSGKHAVKFGDSGNSLDAHVRMIKRQIDRSMADPETIQLARRLVTGRFDYQFDPSSNSTVPVVRAWGLYYRAPQNGPCKPRDAMCEVVAIWNFIVLNLRYTFDPVEPDTFSTVQESLESGGGDCDDSSVMFAALLKSVGFTVILRVISVDGKSWEHIYPVVGVPHDKPKTWVPLDCTVANVPLGWEFEAAKAYRDFPA
jgi:hypothetical protein